MATVNINIHEAFDRNSIHKCYDDLRATYLGLCSIVDLLSGQSSALPLDADQLACLLRLVAADLNNGIGRLGML